MGKEINDKIDIINKAHRLKEYHQSLQDVINHAENGEFESCIYDIQYLMKNHRVKVDNLLNYIKGQAMIEKEAVEREIDSLIK